MGFVCVHSTQSFLQFVKRALVRVRCSLSWMNADRCSLPRSSGNSSFRKAALHKPFPFIPVWATSFRELDFSLSSREQHFHRSISRFVKCQTQERLASPINSHSEVLTEEVLIIDSFYSFLEVATDQQPVTLKGAIFIREGEGSDVGF